MNTDDTLGSGLPEFEVTIERGFVSPTVLRIRARTREEAIAAVENLQEFGYKVHGHMSTGRVTGCEPFSDALVGVDAPLPCPLCGGEAYVKHFSDGTVHDIHCLACGLTLDVQKKPEGVGITREAALAKWNRRVKHG